MEREHLLHVCQIILCGLQLSIPAEMLESRDRPTMIEGAIPTYQPVAWPDPRLGPGRPERALGVVERIQRSQARIHGHDSQAPEHRARAAGLKRQSTVNRPCDLGQSAVSSHRAELGARAPGDGSCAHCLSMLNVCGRVAAVGRPHVVHGGDGITRTRMITLALLGVLAIGTVSASAAAGKSVAYLTGDSELQPVGTAVRLDFAIQLSSCEAAESELDEGTLASNAVKTDEIADIDARGKCAASYRGVKHQITGGVITMTLSASCNGPVHVRPGGQGPNRGRMPTGRVAFDGLRMVRWCFVFGCTL